MERKENKNIDIEELTLFYLFAILRRQCVLFFSVIRLVGCIFIAYIKNFAARLYSKCVGVHLYVWCFQYALYCDFLSICFPKYGSKLNKLYLCVSKKGECVAWQTTHSTCAL